MHAQDRNSALIIFMAILKITNILHVHYVV